MSKNQININILYLITFLVYTQGFWERFTFIPIQSFLELLVWLLALISFIPNVTKAFFLLFIVTSCGLISALYTETYIYYLKYIRFILYFYLIYSVLWNTYFTVSQFNRLLKFIIGMILFQGGASIFQTFIIGERVEGYVGAMSSLGGSTATALPALIIGISMVIFFFAGNFKKTWHLILLLLIISVCLVGYSSGKRAIYFIIPGVIILTGIICRFYYPIDKLRYFFRKTGYLLLITVLAFPFYMYGITTSRGLNYALKANDNNIEILTKALVYAEQYESAKAGGSTIGRTGSTKKILLQSTSSFEYFFFGSGFGAIKDQEETKNRNIGYGIVGITRDIFSGGFILAFLVVVFYIYLIFHKNKLSSDRYSAAFRWILLFIFIFVHFTYSSDFMVHLKLNILVAILLCFLNSDTYCHIKANYFKYFN